MQVYKTLREMRLLRDYAWRQIPHMNARVQEKSQKSKRAMMRVVMDQMATAVADLAKALFMREEWVRARMEDEGTMEEALMPRDRWKKVETYARGVVDGRVDALDKGIERNLARLKELRDQGEKERGQELMTLKRRILVLRTQRNRMLRCKEAVDHVNGISVSEERQAQWSEDLRARVKARQRKIAAEKKHQDLTATTEQAAGKQEPVANTESPSSPTVRPPEQGNKSFIQKMLTQDWRTLHPEETAKPRSEAEIPAVKETKEEKMERETRKAVISSFIRSGWHPSTKEDIEKFSKPVHWRDDGWLEGPQEAILEHRRYVWKMKGTKYFSVMHNIAYPKGEKLVLPPNAIKIKWLDIRDAEHAKSWPKDVYHVHMGLLGYHTKYTMPHPDAGPIREVRTVPNRIQGRWDGVQEDVLLDGEASEEPPPETKDGGERGEQGEVKEKEKRSVWSRVRSLPDSVLGGMWRSRSAARL
jgi:hypothetical protein